jgi:hypothetical protein
MPGFADTLRLAIIQRFPEGERQGILIWIDNTGKSLEETIELAKRIMGAR